MQLFPKIFAFMVVYAEKACNSFCTFRGKRLFVSFRAVTRVKCSLPVPLDSGNSVEKLWGSWVQTRGYEACVFCMPIPLRVC